MGNHLLKVSQYSLASHHESFGKNTFLLIHKYFTYLKCGFPKKSFIINAPLASCVQKSSKSEEKSVQLARGDFVINDFLRNPHFKYVSWLELKNNSYSSGFLRRPQKIDKNSQQLIWRLFRKRLKSNWENVEKNSNYADRKQSTVYQKSMSHSQNYVTWYTI